MNFFPQRTAKNLSDWLEMATRSLVPPVSARIRAEIAAHYIEAVAAHRKNGLPEPDALAAALADLGDAYAAARRFNREHLTKDEAQGVAMNLWFARSMLWSVFMCLPFSGFALFRLLNPGLPDPAPVFWAAFLLSFLGLIAVRIAIYILAGRKSTTARVRQILLLDALSFLVLSVGASVSLRHGIDLYWMAIVALLIFRHLRLRQKLQSAGEDWSKIPPHSTSVD